MDPPPVDAGDLTLSLDEPNPNGRPRGGCPGTIGRREGVIAVPRSTSLNERLVVGVTGSSAPQLAFRFLEALAPRHDIETHLVVSHGARRSIKAETGRPVEELEALASVVHEVDDL